jgi:GGDEF domain-containing protein
MNDDDAETLVNMADTAMYKVKESGKGGFLFFSDIADASPVSMP